MEPKFQTSFIPKKPIVSSEGSGIKVVHSANIFSVIATVLFLVTVILSGGIFVYKRVVLSQINQAKKSIEDAREALEPEKIRELIDANSRIVSSKNLLDKHIAASQILLLLQDLTVKMMRFTDLSYKNIENKVDLVIKGEIQTYNALAQQEVVFKENEFFKNPEFSNITLTDNGSIKVDFVTTIDPSLISYKKVMESLTPDQ